MQPFLTFYTLNTTGPARLLPFLWTFFASALLVSAADPISSAAKKPGTAQVTDPVTAVRLNTNSFSTMDTLDDKKKLGLGDHLSFRIVEDQEDPKESLDPKPPLVVTDSGDVEVPYIGRFPAL